MIVDNVNETKSELDLSKQNMDELLRCVKVSNDANANVSRELLQLLCQHTGKMQSIIDMINSIASQTSLLALNASIEAAKGRGRTPWFPQWLPLRFPILPIRRRELQVI